MCLNAFTQIRIPEASENRQNPGSLFITLFCDALTVVSHAIELFPKEISKLQWIMSFLVKQTSLHPVICSQTFSLSHAHILYMRSWETSTLHFIPLDRKFIRTMPADAFEKNLRQNSLNCLTKIQAVPCLWKKIRLRWMNGGWLASAD